VFEMLPINLIDLSVVILCAVGAYVGSRLGVVCAAFYILGGLAGSAAATRFYLPFGTQLPFGPSAPFFAYMVIFLLVGGFFAAMGVSMSRRFDVYFLDLYDRFIGSLLGILLSFVLALSIFISLLIQPRPSFQERVSGSVLVRPLLLFAGSYLKVVPPPMADQIRKKIQNPPWDESTRDSTDSKKGKP